MKSKTLYEIDLFAREEGMDNAERIGLFLSNIDFLSSDEVISIQRSLYERFGIGSSCNRNSERGYWTVTRLWIEEE